MTENSTNKHENLFNDSYKTESENISHTSFKNNNRSSFLSSLIYLNSITGRAPTFQSMEEAKKISDEANRNYYSSKIGNLNIIAREIFNRETKQYNDVYSKASKLKNGDEKDIVIRNIVKEHSEVQKKYDEINRLILSSSNLDLKLLAEKVDKIEKEVDNLEDESEQINEFGDLSTDFGNLYDLYNEFSDILKNPENKSISYLEKYIDTVNHQLALLNFAEKDFLYDIAINILNSISNNLFEKIISDGSRSEKDLEEFKELSPINKIRAGRNLICDILIEKKKKIFNASRERYFESKSNEYGNSINSISGFEDKIRKAEKVKHISSPELNDYFKYLKSHGELTYERISYVFDEKKIKEIKELWNDGIKKHWNIEKMPDFKLGLAEVFIHSGKYKNDESMATILNNEKLIKDLYDKENVEYSSTRKQLEENAQEYFKGNEEVNEETKKLYQTLFSFDKELLEDKDFIKKLIKFPEGLSPEEKDDVAKIITESIKNVEPEEGKLIEDIITEEVNKAIDIINQKYEGKIEKMPHTSSKYILLKKHEVSINRTKSDIKDLEDKIQQVNEINKDINEAKERIKTLRNYLTQAHDESEKNEIRDEIRGLRIGLRNSIRSKDKLNLKEASAYQEEKNRLTERLKLTESSYEEINKMSNKDIQDVQKTQDFNDYHKKVLLRAYIKEVYSEEDAKEIFITLDKENDKQQIIKEEETNEDTEKNSVEEMKKENNSLISDWIDDSFFENSSKSNNFVKLETPKGFTADIKVENGVFTLIKGMNKIEFKEVKEMETYLVLANDIISLGLKSITTPLLSYIKDTSGVTNGNMSLSNGITGYEYKIILRNISTMLGFDNKKYDNINSKEMLRRIRLDIINSGSESTIQGNANKLLKEKGLDLNGGECSKTEFHEFYSSKIGGENVQGANKFDFSGGNSGITE